MNKSSQKGKRIIDLPDLESTKEAYLKLAQQYHPDSGSKDPEKFIEVKSAWDRLSELNNQYKKLLLLSSNMIN